MAGEPSLWLAGHSSRPPPPSSLGSFLVNQRRYVSTKSLTKPAQTLTSWPLGPLGLGFGSLGPRAKYTPEVMFILTFGQLHFVIH
jgi:hypothetical protein